MMKATLLSTLVASLLGIHLSMPNPAQIYNHISQQLQAAEQQLTADVASIEQLLMSGNFGGTSRSGISGIINGIGQMGQTGQSNTGDFQHQIQIVNQDIEKVQELLAEGMTANNHIRRLPTIQGERTVDLTNGITLSAGDPGVHNRVLTMAKDFISQVSLPILQTNLGQIPKNTKVVLFSSKRAYANALAKGGVDAKEIPSIVSGTGGITVGSEVWIPLYALQNQSDLANVLTHELTHAVFNQEGIGDNIPTWLNEGTAWMDGMAAQKQVDPSDAELLTAAYNQDLQKAAQDGQLLPLTASEEDILNAPYNVEWEDYLAVKNLVQTYGSARFRTFLAHAHSGVAQSYADTFGIKMSSYEGKLDQEINAMN